MTNELIADACQLTLSHSDFVQDFIQLSKNELNVLEPPNKLSEEQVLRLIETASLFSLNKETLYQKLAFKIAVYLLKQYRNEYPNLSVAVEIIMARLGDLPTIRSMLDNKDGEDYFAYFSEDSEYNSIATYLNFPEILIKKLTNQTKTAQGRQLSFTDAQAKVFSLLKSHLQVAFSAPTSAGKSYVIHNYIAERVSTHEKYRAVYVAPTKALIAEIQDSISRAITVAGVKPSDFAVFTSINFLNAAQAKITPKVVYVLTQERLQEAMANTPLDNVDLLIVDEAHKISDEGRGIIVEDAVSELIAHNSNCQAVFISPYIQDTYRFRLIFGLSSEIHSEITSNSPVGRNIFRVNCKGKNVDVSLMLDEVLPSNTESIALGQVRTNIDISSGVKKKAWVATHLVPKGEPTIIYCNIPSNCRQVATYIAQQLPDEEPSAELQKAIAFFAEHVHHEYYLCDSLKNRIGYHYGRMPQFVRFYIKKLFEMKEIDRLCCTSTLLEGVNMPAKNIILLNPKMGQKIVMNRLSVLNLAGRAGRLLQDYYGKVYCIDLKDWAVGEHVFDNKLENIESAAETTLEKNASSLIQYLRDVNYLADANVQGLATSLLMKTLIDPEAKFLDLFWERHKEISQSDLIVIRKLLNDIISNEIKLDHKIILRNRTFDPRLQNELYRWMQKNFFEAVPSPDDLDFCDRLKGVFRLISRYLLKEVNESYLYYAGLAWKWVCETPYKTLVDDKISYEKNSGYYKIDFSDKSAFKAFVNEMIDRLDDDLETTIKYDYTRGLKCYLDIAEKVMAEKQDFRPLCKALPTYIEAGASSDNILLMLDIGISRSVAIMIAPLMEKRMENASSCVNWLLGHEVNIKDALSEILFREVETVLNRYREKSI